MDQLSLNSIWKRLLTKFKGKFKTMTTSNFDCKKCGYEMLFIDGKLFFCENCGFHWELTELGERLLRSIEL